MRCLLFLLSFVLFVILGGCKTDKTQIDELIMPEILNLPRHKNTARIDECENIRVVWDRAGRRVYTFCEKLLPGIAEDRKYKIAQYYAKKIEKLGWEIISGPSKRRNQYYLKNTSNFKDILTLNINAKDVRGCSNGSGTTKPCVERNGEFRQIMFSLTVSNSSQLTLNHDKITFQFNVSENSDLPNDKDYQPNK